MFESIGDNMGNSIEQIDSVCAYCGVGCDISATVEDNKILSIGAKKEGEVSEGQLCVKGTHGFHFSSSSNRLGAVKVRKKFLEKNGYMPPASYIEDEEFIYPSLEYAYKISAWKLVQLREKYGKNSFAAIGGARGNCESSYVFQKFTREVMHSAHIDNCARVCHAPSLKGMRSIIGEGAATNPFSDIYKTDFMIILGSNTTEAHPIVANKIISRIKNGASMALFDVRNIIMSKKAKYNCIIPFESNLMIVNMLAHVIISENLYDKEFVANRAIYFDEYKRDILNDPYANPDFFQQVKGYEYLTDQIKEVAREYASKRSMIFWGLGVTEHLDGSYTTASICNLAILTGNVGKEGAGLMPLRGQNNVQGTCDMGALPYYDPDYKHPQVEGLKTPEMLDAMIDGKIKALFNMGEDIAHIHTNQNKIQEALKNLEFIIVNELFDNEITKYADIIYGVKSGYEKSGVYVNAERRLHLSQPLVYNDLPDDWEVISAIARELGYDDLFNYSSSKDVWEEVRIEVSNRFSGASYEKLEKNRLKGLQWPVKEEDTPILHIDKFRTKDGKGHLKYHFYEIRGMVEELVKNSRDGFYLTTGRVLSHYNNSAQTKESPRLIDKHSEDILLVSIEDKEFFKNRKEVVLSTSYGQSAPLRVKISKNIKKGTLYTSFHHSKSKINFLFGDESDSLTKTARFKSLKVDILEP